MESLRDEIRGGDSDDIDQVPELARFTPHIGELFDVSTSRGVLQIELVEAIAVPGGAGTHSEDAFSLLFRADRGCDLDQGSVAIEHEKVGWVVLFLVAIGENENGRYFEAIIS